MPRSATLPPPPGVINALRAGFDAVSAHAWVIAMPVMIDLFFWLGPRLRMDMLMRPALQAWTPLEIFKYTPEQVETTRAFYNQIFTTWNLFDLLRTFPVGVSSLMAWLNTSGLFSIPTDSSPTLSTPIGNAGVIQVSSAFGLLIWFVGLTFLGWVAGSIYYYSTSRIIYGDRQFTFGTLASVIFQTILLSVIWASLLFFLGFPVFLIITILSYTGPFMAYSSMICMSVAVIWLLLPVFFSAHGIYTQGQNAFHSILGAFRFVRFTAPTSGLFAILVVVLSQGLNMLWSIPEKDSWMLLVGIAGHAFITTALLAASFIYYRDMSAWLQIAFKQMRQQTAAPQV